jgi:hypothetical protein
LGEFSPIGRFTFCSFSEITEAAHVFKLPFSTDKVEHLILAKNVLGYILNAFFKKSSGHPENIPDNPNIFMYV